MQKKTQRPVQFEITEQTRDAVAAWIATACLKAEQFLFPNRVSESPQLPTRQYSRIVGSWVESNSPRWRGPTDPQGEARLIRYGVSLLLGRS
jgi:hypothetical protein